MEEKNDVQKEYSTCLENFSFAETMQKKSGQQEAYFFIDRFTDDKSSLWTGKSSKNRINQIVASLISLHRCADCAIRCRAKAMPYSIFARIHRWHKTWWPGWKIYQAELHSPAARLTVAKKIFIQEER
jgi:hypothetical protein